MGSVNPVTSVSWNASRPIAARGTCPVIITMGTESIWAAAMPVARLVAPGPEVAVQTPTFPVERAYPSAAIAAAFTVDDPLDALKIGLSEIPKDCELANAINWAFEIAPKITNYQEARNAVDEKFEGMHRVHTINNACLTLWGIKIGGTDITRVIGETVAMGLDNDCTAATAGSIVGAVVGKSGVPEHWYRNFNDTIHSYLIDRPSFSITDVLDRFNNQASQCLQ